MSPDFRPSASVIADSLSPAGRRLTTLEVHLHRFVLAELNTHRSLSRNSASSRAVPVGKTIATAQRQAVYPLRWSSEKTGMQGGNDLTPPQTQRARAGWDGARAAAIDHARLLHAIGVHKSVVNRLLEPFLPHTVIISATDWDGLFTQRCSPLAQPEMQAAAEAIRAAVLVSTPRPIKVGRWHLPYITAGELAEHSYVDLRRISAARCARVSYLTHDGRRDTAADLNLFARLVAADPPHLSPLEHVATPVLDPDQPAPGNFTGWRQLRHLWAEGNA